MAVIMAETYPELFCAVGVHSGLPFGSAHNASSALTAMRGLRSADVAPPPLAQENDAPRAVPTIVFHGDHDATVESGNGLAIVEQAIARASALLGPLRRTSRERDSVNGREYSVSSWADSRSTPVVEHWIIHNAGHAWSGGSSKGSFADDLGPHASMEMVRFFLAQNCLG